MIKKVCNTFSVTSKFEIIIFLNVFPVHVVCHRDPDLVDHVTTHVPHCDAYQRIPDHVTCSGDDPCHTSRVCPSCDRHAPFCPDRASENDDYGLLNDSDCVSDVDDGCYCLEWEGLPNRYIQWSYLLALKTMMTLPAMLVRIQTEFHWMEPVRGQKTWLELVHCLCFRLNRKPLGWNLWTAFGPWFSSAMALVP